MKKIYCWETEAQRSKVIFLWLCGYLLVELQKNSQSFHHGTTQVL